MDEKCCPRADVVSTHWEGCHTIHPECAAYKAGREAGMREAAGIAESEADRMLACQSKPRNMRDDMAETINTNIRMIACGPISVRDAILAAIGEGK